jgi:adenosine deaminase
VTEEELLQMQKNAVECSFAADEVKEEVLRQL